MTKPHDDKDEEALQPRESAATREAAPTTQTKKRKVWWIVLALIATLVIAGLVMGLVLGLDDDEEEEDEKDNRLDAACIMATNALYANNPKLDQFMENLDRDEWTQYEKTGKGPWTARLNSHRIVLTCLKKCAKMREVWCLPLMMSRSVVPASSLEEWVT